MDHDREDKLEAEKRAEELSRLQREAHQLMEASKAAVMRVTSVEAIIAEEGRRAEMEQMEKARLQSELREAEERARLAEEEKARSEGVGESCGIVCLGERVNALEGRLMIEDLAKNHYEFVAQ